LNFYFLFKYSNFIKGRNDLNVEKLFTKFRENWEEVGDNIMYLRFFA